MDTSAKIYVAGHNGLVGGAIVRALKRAHFSRLILRSHAELNLCEQAKGKNDPSMYSLQLPR